MSTTRPQLDPASLLPVDPGPLPETVEPGRLYCLTGESGHAHAARALAAGGRLRAPHFTCSETALLAELALACGGVLYLDESTDFRVGSLWALLRTWRAMDVSHRPTLVLGVREPRAFPEFVSANIVRWGEAVGVVDGTIVAAAPARSARGAA